MKKIIDSVRKSLSDRNLYVALFVSLTIPDICVAIESGTTNGKKYAEWFENNLPQYSEFLSGDDCYALRCSLLHQGKDDTTEQKAKDILEHYVFMTSDARSHCTLFNNCSFNGVEKSFLELNTKIFCSDMCDAASNWLDKAEKNSIIADRLKKTIEIHEVGYTYKGIIKFD